MLTAKLDEGGAYGRVVRDEEGNFVKVVEANDASEEERAVTEINTGLYCFKSRPMFRYLKRVDNDNEQGEYYLTDVLGLYVADGEKVEIATVDDPTEVMGVDNLKALEHAEEILEKRAGEA